MEAALRVLNTADPFEKARLGDEVANQWLQGDILLPYDASVDIKVPDRPARLANVRRNALLILFPARCSTKCRNEKVL